LLRRERATSPLAHPDTLVYLIDPTLDEVLRRLGRKPAGTPAQAPHYAAIRAKCGCGRNPLLAFFLAGEQAMLEAAILAQAEKPALDPLRPTVDIAEIYCEFRDLANREVEALCGVCQHHNEAEGEPLGEGSSLSSHATRRF
jgi:hypothetical protein